MTAHVTPSAPLQKVQETNKQKENAWEIIKTYRKLSWGHAILETIVFQGASFYTHESAVDALELCVKRIFLHLITRLLKVKNVKNQTLTFLKITTF